MPGVALYELARVGHRRLLGEVIRVREDTATLQVYEETTGLAARGARGAVRERTVRGAGARSLGCHSGRHRASARPVRGADRSLHPARCRGRHAGADRALGRSRPRCGSATSWRGVTCSAPCPSAPVSSTASWCRLEFAGIVSAVVPGDFTVREDVGRLEDGTPLRLAHPWAVRRPRPVAERLPDDRPFVTGQRVFDFLFPVAEGGAVVVPGGFGTGKTVIEQSLAKYAEADIVVYIGCGERGNEMAELLHEFPRLIDRAHRAVHHGPHRDGREHVEHAGRRARGLGLSRHHDRRVLPRHGLSRRLAGRQPLALGGGVARDRRPPGRDAGRGRLSHLPRRPGWGSSSSGRVGFGPRGVRRARPR